MSPGRGWLAPTHVTQLTIVFWEYEARNGNSLPTPFWMMTKVVESLTTLRKREGIAAMSVAL